MNTQEVDIRLVSRQSDGQDTEETEVLSQGRFSRTEEGFVIEYEESEATGYEGCVTRLEAFGDDKVVMSRTGAVVSNMIVQLGEKHHCVYGTLYGNFEVGVTAKKIAASVSDEDGGLSARLFFSYVVDVNSSYVGDFEIEVDVRAR